MQTGLKIWYMIFIAKYKSRYKEKGKRREIFPEKLSTKLQGHEFTRSKKDRINPTYWLSLQKHKIELSKFNLHQSALCTKLFKKNNNFRLILRLLNRPFKFLIFFTYNLKKKHGLGSLLKQPWCSSSDFGQILECVSILQKRHCQFLSFFDFYFHTKSYHFSLEILMIKECSFRALTCSTNYMLKDNKKKH